MRERSHALFPLVFFAVTAVAIRANLCGASSRGCEVGLRQHRPSLGGGYSLTGIEDERVTWSRIYFLRKKIGKRLSVRGGATGGAEARGAAAEGIVVARGGGNATRSPKMNRLRDAVFPIYGSQEVGKFFALAGIQFFIIFVLTLTRDLKDTLIITSCGAEAISFLKV